MKQKIYIIEVSSKISKQHALYFYVKAVTLPDAVLYSQNYLVPDALEITGVEIYRQEESKIYCEIFDANQDVPV